MYKLGPEPFPIGGVRSVIRLSDGAAIPFHEGNSDYKEFLEWVSAGNSPLPADNPQPLTYRERRAQLYAPIQDQLDMQYHDKINGTTTWLDHISSVKNAVPKTQY